MARRLLLKTSVGERLLTSKLQILNGTGARRPSVALSLLTGRISDDGVSADEDRTRIEPRPGLAIVGPTRPLYSARTVYLSEVHVRDIDRIIEILSRQQSEPRRLTRSAVLRRAVEHLRAAVEADPDKSLLEND